jgi:hypothetical protein
MNAVTLARLYAIAIRRGDLAAALILLGRMGRTA